MIWVVLDNVHQCCDCRGHVRAILISELAICNHHELVCRLLANYTSKGVGLEIVCSQTILGWFEFKPYIF
jgi:hypothetical protein